MKTPKLKFLIPALSVLAFAGSLSAQDLFTWSYSAVNGDGASGTLTATNTDPGSFEWTIDSISGNWHSPNASITGLATGYGNDNLFYYGFSGTSSSLGNGVGFTTSGSSDVVVFNNGGELIYPAGGDTPSGNSAYPNPETPDYQFRELGPVTGAPWEPSDVVFICGALGFGLMQYKRVRRKVAA